MPITVTEKAASEVKRIVDEQKQNGRQQAHSACDSSHGISR